MGATTVAAAAEMKQLPTVLLSAQTKNGARDVDWFRVKALAGREGFCVREHHAAGNEIAAVVTRQPSRHRIS